MRDQFHVEQQERQSLAKSIRVGGMCRVERFDSEKMTVDVQPLSKRLDAGVYRTPPMVLDVPVSLIRGGGFVLRPWYTAGDVGVLFYVDHDIDRIVEAGRECQPNTERNHSDEDAVFVGAFVPTNNPVTGLPGNALVMATEGGGLYIAIKPDKIEIKGDIVLYGDIDQIGNIKQTGRTDVTDDVTAAGISLKEHTHSCPDGTTGKPD